VCHNNPIAKQTFDICRDTGEARSSVECLARQAVQPRRPWRGAGINYCLVQAEGPEGRIEDKPGKFHDPARVAKAGRF
jgi:hypothetical protein